MYCNLNFPTQTILLPIQTQVQTVGYKPIRVLAGRQSREIKYLTRQILCARTEE